MDNNFPDVYYIPYSYDGVMYILCRTQDELNCYDYENFFLNSNGQIIKFENEEEAQEWVARETILKFIKNFSGAKDTFLYGCCYWFAVILKERFHGEIYYNEIINHFTMKYGCRLYDVSGDVTEKHLKDSRSWDTFEQYDSLLFGRIKRDCILKI